MFLVVMETLFHRALSTCLVRREEANSPSLPNLSPTLPSPMPPLLDSKCPIRQIPIYTFNSSNIMRMINRIHSNGMQFPLNQHKRVQTFKTVIEVRAGDDKRVQTGNSPTNLAKLVPALLTDSAGGIGILTTVLAVRGIQTVGVAVSRLSTAAVSRFNRTFDDNNVKSTPTPSKTNTRLQSDATSLILADTAPILDTVTPKSLTPQVVDNKEEKEEEEEEEEVDKEEEPLVLLPLTTPAEPNEEETINIEREQDVITNITTTTTPVDRSHIAYLSAPSSPKQVEEEEREEEEVVAPSSASSLLSSPLSPTLSTIPTNATKGGRHISMLSSPMSYTASNNNNKGSSSAGGKVEATSSGGTGGSSASSFASRLPALNAAKGGGSGGGDGNGGGGGGGGKSDGEDGNNNNNRKMGILLVAVLVLIGSTMVAMNNNNNNKKADATVTKKKK